MEKVTLEILVRHPAARDYFLQLLGEAIKGLLSNQDLLKYSIEFTTEISDC